MDKGGDIDADVSSSNTFDILGLDDINLRTAIAVTEPIRNEITVTVPEPVVLQTMRDFEVDTNSAINLDIRPLTVDL